MRLYVSLLLWVFYRSVVAENLCEDITGTDLVFKCGGCRDIVLCLGNTFYDSESCNEKYCHYDADSEMADCLPAVPVGCEDGTTTIEPPETTTALITTTTDETTTVEITTTTTTEAPTTTSLPIPTTTRSSSEAAILCTGIGIYPDPYNCNRYHYCPAAGQQSWDQLCPPNYSFAYKSELLSGTFPCKLITLASDCTRIDCASTSIFKPFASSKLHYAYCYTTSPKSEVSVFKCSEGATFDGSTCVYNCLCEGLFTNTVAPTTYYQCYYSGSRLVSKLVNCPTGKNFVESLKTCI
ncbi:hypothetical protein RP20_CCG010728 [Aedes albopictus]|nr:hypothetical protein RP20_CCG010728 [Aedes albopictus]